VAVWHGADAVYLAAQDFGMRAAPANFTFEQLKTGVEFAHNRGVKVYQTVNVLPSNRDVQGLEYFLRKSQECGVDAFIVADVGILMFLKRILPDVEVHISVQMGVVNYLTANELYQLGAKRVVLARELTIDEIAEIRENTPDELEIECFVHGAICMSISGRCLISKYFVNRDANQGECAQPCRWEYDISDPRRPEIKLNVLENSTQDQDRTVISGGSYILNSKDLNLVGHIPQLALAGVYSLKVEGRAKSSFYVASVINAYRKAIDYYKSVFSSAPERFNASEVGKIDLPAEIIDDVQKISHREYTTGFYFAGAVDDSGEVVDGFYSPDASPSSSFAKGYKQEWKPLAIKLEDGWHQRGKFALGEEVELIVPATADISDLPNVTSAVAISGLNAKGQWQEQENTAHADQLLRLELTSVDAENLPLGTFLRGRI
jgi:putative protease